MPNREELPAIFERLRSILEPYEPALVVQTDGPGGYVLNTPFAERYRKELLFGAVYLRKSYVSYYLMPVYVFPELLDGISAGLGKRMQGKSCFNFRTLDEELLAELAELTRRSFERFRHEGLVGERS